MFADNRTDLPELIFQSVNEMFADNRTDSRTDLPISQ